MDYDLDNRIIKVDIDNNDVEKYRRLVGILDLESEANVARRVSSREASLNQCAEHKHQAGQTVIQNDIMAHPSRLNSVIARAVDGSKFKLEWYHKNYLDHVYAVSDDSGDILEHYRYTAFGEVQIYNSNGNQVSTTQIDNHILWNTRRRDELTGYYMYKFRHYSAELGRWLGRDPIEEWGGINLYTFVGNDPLNWWDVLGLSKKKGLPAPLCEDDKNTDDDHEKALKTAINNYKKNWVVTKVKVEGPSPVDCPGQPTTKGESYIVTVRFTKKGVVPGKNLPPMIPTVPDNKPKKGDPPFTGDTVKFPDDFQSKLHIRCCKCCIKDKKGKITIITKCAVAHYEYGTHGPKQGGKDHVFPIPRPDHIPKPKEPKK